MESNKNSLFKPIIVITLAVIFTYPIPAFAQFEGLLNAINKISNESGLLNALPGNIFNPNSQNSNLNNNTVNTTTSSNSSQYRSASYWCETQVGLLNGVNTDTSVIASEFNIQNTEEVQDLFVKAFKKSNNSKTFPDLRFFQSSFETKQVRSIYDNFVSYPEPETLAALIHISRDRNGQEAQDALMALTFIHLQANHLSISKDRWRQLHQRALTVENFPALVFKGRMYAYGEYENKDLAVALGALQNAGELRDQYRNSSGYKKEFDNQNYQIIHTKTIKDILKTEANIPYKDQLMSVASIAIDIERAQEQFEKNMPNTKIGKMFADAAVFNQESIAIGNSIVNKSKVGNQLIAQIGNLKSIQNRNDKSKLVFEDISPEIHRAQIEMIAKTDQFDDTQKALLLQAQEKRLIAQGVIFKTHAEINKIMQNSFAGGLVAMAAPLPALKQANNSLIQSCIISAKWEQAMRAREIQGIDTARTNKITADINAQYQD
jgi:hypothetical protein